MFVGQMRPYKGVPHLLEAVAGHEELSVTLVGGGGLLDDYRALAQRLHATNATFAGRVPDEAFRMLYAEHDVIVLPSTTRAEAFGLVLLEGMSAGCVPVASDLPGVREVAGPTGLLVPPNNPAALRDALLQLARDPERLADMSTRSVARSEQFDWRYTVAAYESLTQEMVEKVQARRARGLGGRWGDDPVPVLADVRDAFGASWASLMLFDRPRSRLALRAAWGSGSARNCSAAMSRASRATSRACSGPRCSTRRAWHRLPHARASGGGLRDELADSVTRGRGRGSQSRHGRRGTAAVQRRRPQATRPLRVLRRGPRAP